MNVSDIIVKMQYMAKQTKGIKMCDMKYFKIYQEAQHVLL